MTSCEYHLPKPKEKKTWQNASSRTEGPKPSGFGPQVPPSACRSAVRQHQKVAAQYKNKMPLDFLFQNLVSKLQSDSQRERYERFSLARRFVPLLAKTLNVRWSRARLVIARPPPLPPPF
jgi:hypothetical protein